MSSRSLLENFLTFDELAKDVGCHPRTNNHGENAAHPRRRMAKVARIPDEAEPHR
jgi:hypothetical protein